MKKSSRILAFVLTLLMVVSLMPVSALADELAPASAAESLLLPGMVDIPAIEETETPVATETPAPTEAPVETEQPEATEAPVLPELDVVLPEVGSAADAVIGEAAETEEEAPVEDVEEAAEDGDSTLVASAIFFSDVHGSTSDLSAVMGGIGSNVDASVVGFDGDTSLTIEKATAAVTSGLGYSTYTDVYSYASSHDKENSSDIGTYWDYSGEAYGEESGENYYVYVIRETDMQNASDGKSAAANFTTWVNGLTIAEKTKPLFILSHRPLHDRRSDNAGAPYWYTAISAAAEEMDITFFWAHNHTGETEADTNAYYVAKDGSETFTVYNGSTVTPNFTYMNAGYINANNQNPARKGIATTVGIYADSMKFQDYNSSGTYTDSTYSHNVTVEREFASSGTTTPTLSSISVVRNKLMYSLGEDLDITVYAIYEGQAEPVEVTDYTTDFKPNTAGVQTVTVSYGGKDTTMKEVIVAAAIDHSDVSIDEYEETASLSALEAGTAEICREWTCYLSNTQTLSLDWEITDNGDGTYTVTCIGPISEMASEVTYEVNGDTLVLTSVDNTYADEGYETATKTYTINSDGTLTEAGKGVSYLYISERTDAYTIGDELYAKILVTREDGSTEYVTLNDCTVDPSCSCGATTVDDLMNTVALGEAGSYHQVTIGYGGKTVDLQFTVGEAVAHEFDTGITVSVSDFVSASGTVVEHADTTDLTIPATIENFVAYDITPVEGKLNPGNYAEITFPIPEGVANPVVYCVDTAEWFEDINKSDDAYTVRTSHFSTWIIGETTVIEVPENVTATDETTTSSSVDKTVYVLVDKPENGEEYLIVSNDYALVNSSGSATGVSVADQGEITIDGTTYEGYIELDNANAVWTAATGWTFKNGNHYLSYSTSSSGGGNMGGTSYSVALSTSSTNWTYNSTNSYLYFTTTSSGGGNMGGGNQRTSWYLYYGSNGWTLSSQTNSNGGSNRTVYFYKEVTYKVDNSVTKSGTYSIEGEDISVAVAEGSTANLTSTLIFTPGENNTATVESPVDVSTNATYEIVTVDKDGKTVDGDPNDIISKIENGVVTFTGNYGTALVKVSYTTEFGEVTDYITIEAKAPYYTIDLCEPTYTEVTITAFEEGVTYYTKNDDGTYTAVASDAEFSSETTYYTFSYESITAPVALKGVAANDTYSVWAVVKEHNAKYPDGKDLGDLDDGALHWVVSDESIATIDSATGVITFTGTNYGTITVTAYYLDDEGKPVCEDTITISVAKSLYIVPGDGTNDFPIYPAEGAIRFDKTATAVGNFSETGISMVELSMTGTPYSTGNAIDVLLMIDMSTSMDTEVEDGVDRVEVTIAAAKAFAKSIVQNDDGSYNSNKIAIKYFNGSTVYTTTDYITVSNDTELKALYTLIEGLYTPTSSGTYYSVAMKDAHDTIIAQDKVSDNTQALVFMSDGGPTYYTYLNDSGTASTVSNSPATIVGWFDVDDNDTTDETDDTATPNSSFKTEYYSYQLKKAGYPVYTVGLGLSNNSTGPEAFTDLSSGAHEAITSYILAQMATSSSYFYNIADEDATANMGNIFSAIAASIKEAATDVVVEDKIGSDYNVNFSLPSGVTSEDTDGLEKFYIQVVDYVLDGTTHERTGVYTVLENFTFGSDGTLESHTVDGETCAECSDDDTTNNHVTFTGGEVTAIDGTYFDYKSDSTGEYLTWASEKVSSTELCLQYFAYLNNSAGLEAENQVPAGVYYTNEYATLTYKNFQGKQVQQEFPVPQMTWKGAQVTYLFYLVNDDGQPVNKSGLVVPFAEAVYVTAPFTYAVTWSDNEGVENLLAKNLFAEANVPDVYDLYDESAYYEIRVYQTEGVDNNAVNYNYFSISGSDDKLIDSEMDTDTTVNNSTTKVFNTKSGKKYDEYGVYSQQTVGTVLNTTDADGNAATVTTTVKATDIDYADTTVAFAVVWKPALRPDTVVIDYGLPVDIDVIATDSLAAGVVGVRADAPANVAINSGRYTADKAEGAEVKIGDLTIGSASVQSLRKVRFVLDETNGMKMSEPAVFYYEADVNFYDDNDKLQTTSMYSSVTVIPATTIYYEDSFVTFTDGTTSAGTTTAWATDGTTVSGTQALDRPGPDKYGVMSNITQDADNVYGYDSAYDNMAKYSMGSARYVTVSADNNPSKGGAWPTAEFTFTGTGFDIISMTDNTTGTIFVDVYAGTDTTGDAAYNWVVDTYYGYARERSSENPWLKHTWTYYASGWHVSTEEVTEEGKDGVSALPESPEVGYTCVMYEANYIWTAVDNNDPNALYQVPVINGTGLTYGTYTVVITPMYAAFFDHADKDKYTFYLDAIRIYDPANEGAAAVDSEEYPTVADVYNKDSELAPDYYELRDWVLKAEEVTSVTENPTTTLEGIAFIDTIFVDAANGAGAGEVKLVADYNEVGPNNELYLTCGNAIAFNLDGSKDGYTVQSIQLGMKSVGGNAVVKVYDPTATKSADATAQTLSTATDMYYDITDLNGKIVVIENAGTEEENAILSITNIKITYVASTTTTADDFLSGYNLGAVALTGTSLIEEAEVAVVEEDEVILDGTAGDEATEESVFTVTAQTVEAAIKALGNATDETSAEDNTGSGEEETPGDEESGGDAGDDTTGDDTTGDDTTGDDTTEEDDDTTSAAVSLINKVNKILQSIRDILSSVLGWLGR